MTLTPEDIKKLEEERDRAPYQHPIDKTVSPEEFNARMTRALCPLCHEGMSDDGCNSNCVYVDHEGVLWEYYGGAWKYGHQTVACGNHHHFTVKDAKIADHIPRLDGVLRGWVLHDFGLLKKD